MGRGDILLPGLQWQPGTGMGIGSVVSALWEEAVPSRFGLFPVSASDSTGCLLRRGVSGHLRECPLVSVIARSVVFTWPLSFALIRTLWYDLVPDCSLACLSFDLN